MSESKWTRFMDMHSGGGCKEAPYEYILIEAPEDEARRVFYNRFGHSPDRVSCTCCGEDYSVSESESLAKATAYDRSCEYIEDARGWGAHKEPDFREGRYIEKGEPVPAGYKVSATSGERYGRRYRTVEQYIAEPYVLVIRAAEIKPDERSGEIPTQGYVWIE